MSTESIITAVSRYAAAIGAALANTDAATLEGKRLVDMRATASDAVAGSDTELFMTPALVKLLLDNLSFDNATTLETKSLTEILDTARVSASVDLAAAIDTLKDSVGASLNTLGKLAIAINNDPAFAATIAAALATKETPAGAQAKADGAVTTANAFTTNAISNLTKADVGLGMISNYGVASQATAEQGTANNLYMTPLRVAQAIAVMTAANALTLGGQSLTAILDTAGATADAKISAAIAGLIDGAGTALDTLNELAAALGDDPNFAATVTNALATKETPAGAQAKVNVHANDLANPHAVTKAQVGLGTVEDLPIATQLQAQGGAVNTAYMTPLRVRDAIYALGDARFIQVGGKAGDSFLLEGNTVAQILASAALGNAATASKLATARTIALSGDVVASGSFDGSGNLTLASVLANSGVTAAVYGSSTTVPTITVNAKGLITAAANTAIRAGTTSATGIVQLSSATNSTSTTLAATPSAVKAAYDLANLAIPAAQKGVANGVATLDATGKIPSTQLPGFVDDVLEFSTFSALTGGVAGVIYVTLDTNKSYRWSGTQFVEISASPGSTDSVVEGTNNLYYTDERAQAAVTSIPGNAATATKLATARNVSITGDGTATATFDGSANLTLAMVLKASGVSAGTYTKVTVDAKGIVTVGGALIPSDVPVLNQNTTGNAATADVALSANNAISANSALKLATARSVSISGDVTGSGGFDGSADLAISLTLGNTGVVAGTYGAAGAVAPITVDAKGRITNVGLPITITPLWSDILSKPTTLSGYGITDAITLSATTPLAAGTASAGTSGSAAKADHVHPAQTNITGNAGSATKLETSRIIAASGDVTGTGNFDGTNNLTLAMVLANSGVTAGTYNNVATQVRPFTVDAKGRITSVGAAVTITPDWANVSGKPTTLTGYGITDAERTSNKGVANGYAGLDATGKVPSSQLPSFVDDVLEYTNLAAFPGTGETGKIYVDLATNLVYRWGGSSYVVISASPGTTDAVVEGSTNLYFTNARAQAAVTSVSGNSGTTTKLATSRSIGVTGDGSGSISFDGSANVNIPLTLANSGVVAGTYNSATLAAPFTVDAKGRITNVGTPVAITPAWGNITGKPTTYAGYGLTEEVQEYANLAAFPVTGVSGIIYVAIDTTGAYRWNGTGYVGFGGVPNTDYIPEGSSNLYFTNARAIAAVGTANAGTATKLATARTIALSGDATASGTFDGSANLSLAVVLANSGVTAGTYNKVTVDAKGRVTAGSNLAAADIPSIDASKITTGMLPIANGGTGANGQAQALLNLGIGSMAERDVIISTAAPLSTQGADGDIWLQYV